MMFRVEFMFTTCDFTWILKLLPSHTCVRWSISHRQLHTGVVQGRGAIKDPSSIKGVLHLETQQRVVATVEDSFPVCGDGCPQSLEEDAPKRILWYKPMRFLGVIIVDLLTGMRPGLVVSQTDSPFLPHVSVHISKP